MKRKARRKAETLQLLEYFIPKDVDWKVLALTMEPHIQDAGDVSAEDAFIEYMSTGKVPPAVDNKARYLALLWAHKWKNVHEKMWKQDAQKRLLFSSDFSTEPDYIQSFVKAIGIFKK